MTFFQCGFKAQYAFPHMDPVTGERTFEKQTLIIAGITTLGDASVCMWLLFEYLHGAYGLTLATIFAWSVSEGMCPENSQHAALWHFWGQAPEL